MFYRKDVFAEKGWTPPKTIDELLALGEQAKSAGMIPVSMGTKEMWPAAGWFDHMNLRINGLEKHIALMDSKMAYTDPAMLPVFDKWAELINAGLFSPNPYILRLGTGGCRAGAEEGGDDGSCRLHQIWLPGRPDQSDRLRHSLRSRRAWAATRISLNSIHVPKNAKNKENARDFLAYFYKPENLSAFLETESAVPPRNDCPPSKDPLVNAAVESLKAVEGSAQYYDRDTDPDMAQEGLKGFQEFMAKPGRRDQILERLEGTRKRIFKA